MPFKVFTSATLSAADINDYLMEQANSAVTSATRPSSPNEGQEIYETDTKKKLIYTGSVWREIARSTGWTTFTPTWTNLTLGNGTNAWQYKYVHGDLWVKGSITAGTTTSIGGNVSMTIPNSETSSSGSRNTGALSFADSSGGTEYAGVARVDVSSTSIFLYANDNNVSASNPVAIATGDVIEFSILISL